MTTTEAAPEQKAEKPVLEPDPWWDIEPGSRISRDDYDRVVGGDRHCRANSRGATDYEGSGSADSEWSCTRQPHPEHWKHVALAGREVLGKWGGSEAGDPNAEEGEPDPDPGPDFKLEVGELYKFRSRKTILQVVGFRRDGRVEVLDLTHLRYRVLRREQLVPRKDEVLLTPEQVRWVGKFMAERRAEARRNALTQRQNGYFRTVDDLNSVLEELKLEPHQTLRRGRVSFDMQIEVRGPGSSDRELRQRLADWFNGIEKPPWLTVRDTIGYHNVYTDMRDI